MRLSTIEQAIIRDAIKAVDADAQIYLHGSRVDDNALGGDIDLMVLSQKIGLPEKLDALMRMHLVLGDKKIDLAVFPDETRPFARLAKLTGVPL